MPKKDGTSPTDEDWRNVIERFKALRDFENAEFLKKAQRLVRVLEREALAVYRIADKFEHRRGHLKETIDLTPITREAIVDRLVRQGFTEHHVRLARLSDVDFLGKRPSSTPRERYDLAKPLRLHASTIISASESVQLQVDSYLRGVASLRRSKNGRKPSLAMHELIITTDQWGSTVPEIARRLVAARVLPERESDDEPAVQWQVILKRARSRTRLRTKDK